MKECMGCQKKNTPEKIKIARLAGHNYDEWLCDECVGWLDDRLEKFAET